ncbi:GNAT family N-acetyltransferase [Oleiharenicola sp. Vm1]|uniref:GNAT family N-acetyltransferase n=1 Tax=Oleiharenicola sp. Vm1 TaxID=3398393 RepID=UPI0039F52500
MAALEILPLRAPARPRDYRDLARLHAGEIREGFLTSLGLPVLEKLYRSIHRSPHAFILVAREGDTTVGFLCASTDTRKVYRRVIFTAWPHLLPALLRRLLSWSTVQRCWETLRYPNRTPPVPDLPGAEILNFCVTAERQGGGVGRALFAAMEQAYRERGVRRIRIVTGARQLSAIRFYEKIGARRVATIEVHATVESCLFVHAIRDCQPSGEAEA